MTSTPQSHCCCHIWKKLIEQLNKGCPHTATRSLTEPYADDVTQHVYHVGAPNTPNQLQHDHDHDYMEHPQDCKTLSTLLTTSKAQSITSAAVTGTPNSSQSHNDDRPRRIIKRRGPFPTRYCSWFQSCCAKPHKYQKHFANHYRNEHLLGHWNQANNTLLCCDTMFPVDGKELTKHVWEIHLALPRPGHIVAE